MWGLSKWFILKQSSVLSVTLKLLWSSHDVSMSLILLHFYHSVSFSHSFLCSLFSPADARCGKGRRRVRAEVSWGDVGGDAQSDTHGAADTHGRRQSLHIPVELMMCVCLCVCVSVQERTITTAPLLKSVLLFPIPDLSTSCLARN